MSEHEGAEGGKRRLRTYSEAEKAEEGYGVRA